MFRKLGETGVPHMSFVAILQKNEILVNVTSVWSRARARLSALVIP